MQLNHGRVTQNGQWISYKTDLYSCVIKCYLELAEELYRMLQENSITTYGDFEAIHVIRGELRLYCLTIKVASTDPNMSILPYQAHSVV